MANRYWVGGTGDWSDNTNHWSASSGGAPNASLPTSVDSVFFDSSSGFGSGGTVTIDIAGAVCDDFTSNTGHTFTITTVEGIEIFGSISIEAGLTMYSEGDIAFRSTLSETIACNGGNMNTYNFGNIRFNGGGTFTLSNNFVATSQVSISTSYGATIFDANDFNITCFGVTITGNVDIATVYMGSGTWEVNGDDSNTWLVEEQNGGSVVINAETSTIKMNNTGSFSTYFHGGDKTYNNLRITGTRPVEVYGSNTFNILTIDSALTVYFESNSTTTVTTANIVGSAGNIITIDTKNERKAPLNLYDPTDFNVTGSELVTNGSFTGSAAGWTLGGGWSYAANTVSHAGDTSGTNYDLSQSITITAGLYYYISFTITASSLDWGTEVSLGGRTESLNTVAVGAHQVVTVPTDSVSPFVFSQNNAVTIDNVSIKLAVPKQHILSKASGTVASDYLNLSHSNAGGGAAWYAGNNSTNTTDNSGWIFTGPPSTGGAGRSMALLGIG